MLLYKTMGGGLMQLVAYGAQDIYLTGNPQITFFKVVYRRHTNFSMEHIQQTFKGTPAASARVVATISRNGDLVHDCFIKFICDDIGTTGSGSVYNPGHNIIDNIEVQIGGQLIDRHYGHWMEIHSELTEEILGPSTAIDDKYTPNSAPVGPGGNISPFQLTAGAGGVKVFHQTSSGKAILFVPLRFWFNRHVGLSLPLIALQYHEVNIIFTFTAIYKAASAARVVNVNNTELWANYIYLDTDERRRFAQVSHEYLIEQIQTQEFGVTSADTSKTLKLNFNHPVKELIWNYTQTIKAWGGTGTGSGALYQTMLSNDGATTKLTLKLNGHDRFSEQEGEYFTRYQPYKYHKNIPAPQTGILDTVSVYSFALKPEEHQPSGTCNFSRIDSSQLIYTDGVIAGDGTIFVYAVNYNVLRIMSGMGGLAYSN
jgi:hypothetical protein